MPTTISLFLLSQLHSIALISDLLNLSTLPFGTSGSQQHLSGEV
jgi:hypothetical protein